MYNNGLIPRSSKMYKNWDFWSEKKPSGNPGPGADLTKQFRRKFRPEFIAENRPNKCPFQKYRKRCSLKRTICRVVRFHRAHDHRI
jgi:hypothetical protein